MLVSIACALKALSFSCFFYRRLKDDSNSIYRCQLKNKPGFPFIEVRHLGTKIPQKTIKEDRMLHF